MFTRVLERLQQSLLGGAIIIGLASVVSRVLGLARDRLLTMTYGGTSPILDSYVTAFKIPDLFFNLLVLGALSASFVPIFIEYQTTKGREEALVVANSVLNIIAVVLVVVVVVVFFTAPWLIGIIAFGDDAESQFRTAHFLRIMVFSLLAFGVSNVLSGILHAQRRFVAYALAPIFYNVGIIIGVLVLVPLLGDWGLAAGVLLGAFLHLFVQLPTVMRTGFIYHRTIAWHHPGVRRLLHLMPPRAFALGLSQLNILVLFAIGSTLPEGSRAVWQFADNLQNFPINIFGVSLALAAFPMFSEAFAENNITRFKKIFSENFRRIFFFVIPVSIMTLLLRAQIVRLVYGAGAFNWEDTWLTAQTLGMFALGMFAQAVIPLLARSYFAKQDTTTPVLLSAVSITVNIVLALVLAPSMGVVGLALTYSLAGILQMMLLLVGLRLRHGDLDDDRIIASTWKIIIASLGMGIIIQGMKYTVAPIVNMETFVGVFLQTGSSAVAGAVTYLLLAVQFRFEEALLIFRRLRAMVDVVRKMRLFSVRNLP